MTPGPSWKGEPVNEERWRIEPLRAEDCDELGRVHVLSWQQSYAGLMPADHLAALDPRARAERWRQSVAGGDATTTYVAKDAGAIVGFVSVGPTRDDDAPTELELWAIYLLARVHGSGLADVLMERALAGRDATLWVLEGNARARAFYRRHGFVEDGAVGTYSKTGTPEIRMVRRRVPVR
jgi:ribosomal protein S18 acetylase RimI-like enzyme